ncbi:hypothetical protein ACKS0A_00096 [Histoplasma ohiense]
MRMPITAAANTGISTALRNILIKEFTLFIFLMVAPFVPSIGSSTFSSCFPIPKRFIRLISRILFHIDINERMAGTQHAAAMSVAVPNVILSGAGMT